MRVLITFPLISLLLIGLASSGFSANEVEDVNIQELKESGRVVKGVVHNVAADRKFERIGGIYQAEGVDKYIKRHFENMSSRLDRMEQKLRDIEGLLRSLQADQKSGPEGVLAT